MKLFNCFTKIQKENIIQTLPIYDNGLDSDNTNHRELLFDQLCDIIKYDDTNPNITTRIEDLRMLLQNKFSNGVIPMYFQQTFYLLDKKSLKNIIFNKIHSINIDFIIEALYEDNEESDTIILDKEDQ